MHFFARDVIREVARQYGVTPEVLCGRSRDRDPKMFQARQIAMTIIRKWLGKPWISIGRLFDGRHNTTVYHYVDPKRRAYDLSQCKKLQIKKKRRRQMEKQA